MTLTDIVRFPDGETARVAGFYILSTPSNGAKHLVPVLPDHPNISLIGTRGMCGKWARPWDLVRLGPVNWSDERLEGEWSTYCSWVKNSDGLNLSGYFELERRFGSPLTGHLRIKQRKWIRGQRRFLASSVTERGSPA